MGESSEDLHVQFEQEWMDAQLDRSYTDAQLSKLGEMDDPRTVDELWDIGEDAARLQLHEDPLPKGFDLTPQAAAGDPDWSWLILWHTVATAGDGYSFVVLRSSIGFVPWVMGTR